MCGIAGKLFNRADRHVSPPEIERMLAPIAHRGPDGHGTYLDGEVGLGHCRLSIIDLAGGSQPMANEDGSVWIVFNGEIYNFEELRTDLQKRGHVFRSRSDTEVIIHLYEEYGVDCLHRLRGMFAFAIWDRKVRRLFLARDRVGIKPLYYSQAGDALHFGSELKSILSDPGVPRTVNPGALRQFLSFTYAAGDETPIAAVRKLAPGHYLLAEAGRVKVRRYWDLQFTRERASRTFDQVAEELHHLVKETVQDHMISDVPVGILLSGGVDSSAVASFAVECSPYTVKSFTVGFDGRDVVDERPYARLAAERFGTDHHEISISLDNFWDFLPQYVRHMEELVCEPPAVALHYVSQLAKGHVKVLLSGEGGDEAFAGYPNYPHGLLADRIGRLLGPMARIAGAAAERAGGVLGSARLQRYGGMLGRPVDQHYFSRTASPLSLFNREAGRLFSSEFLAATDADAPSRLVRELLEGKKDWPLLDQMLYTDSKTWLPDDLLVKADKITMANSLELRVPLLDHRVLEFAASLPAEYKVKGRATKRVLKAALSQALPPEILARKKAGFPVPYGRWLQGPLAPAVRDIVLSSRAVQRGYFNRKEVEALLDGNALNGGQPKAVFSLLVMELWHRQFVDEGAASMTESSGLPAVLNPLPLS